MSDLAQLELLGLGWLLVASQHKCNTAISCLFTCVGALHMALALLLVLN